MDLAHPEWIFAGIAAVLVGVWLIRWAARNNMAGQISGVTSDAAADSLRARGKAGAEQLRASEKLTREKVARYSARNSMSQLAGVLGFILVMGGLMAIVLGVYYFD